MLTADYFSDSRILSGQVSDAERRDLEKRLFDMLLQRAQQQGRKVVILTDLELYERFRNSGDTSTYYLLMDKKRSRILDTIPLAVHLIDTDEGRFYGKVILHSASRRS